MAILGTYERSGTTLRIVQREAVEFGEEVTLYRWECSCGRKGVWLQDVSRVMARAFDHRHRPARVEQPA